MKTINNSFLSVAIHEYSEVYLLDVFYRSDGTCQRNDEIEYHRKPVINKMACFFTGTEYTNLIQALYDITDGVTNVVPPGARLFCASECKTGRDTFRNSGYKISNDRSTANAIIVPDVRIDYFHMRTCNIVAKDEDQDYLYLVRCHARGRVSDDLNSFEMSVVKEYLKTSMNLKVEETSVNNLTVWFLPKCDDLKDIMLEQERSLPYVQESLVPINPPVKFNAETLVFWENVTDPNLLMRTICQSDWMKYPVTLLVFLQLNKPKGYSHWYNVCNGDFRRILNKIDYMMYGTVDDAISDKSLSDKDYEMLQSYMYYKLGLDENGGVVTPQKWNRIPKGIQAILQRRIVLKPFSFPCNSMEYDNISQTLSD